MKDFNPDQKLIFSPEYLFRLKPLKKYDLLFSNLNCSPLQMPYQTGRPPVSKPALLKTLIYKNLKTLPTLYALAVDLTDNPALGLLCGLKPSAHPDSLEERLSSFLRDTANESLQIIKHHLVRELIKLGQIKGHFLSIDSCAIPVPVKENNLKTSVKDRFNKTKLLKGDPEARLGICIIFKQPPKKEIQYFWGYRNHAISDALSELPLFEVTKPANVSDQVVFIPLFTEAQGLFHFPVKEVMGDAIYDTENILKFIIHDLKSIPRIARNPRWEIYSDVKLSETGGLVCIAGFPMLYWGKFRDRGKIRKKFVCPITHAKKFAQKYPQCPWNHPKFVHGKGCTAYLRGDSQIRKHIDYGSEAFKKSYNLRTGSERVFSRLLNLCMQNPSVHGLNAVANHCTIAHITALLIALTAAKSGYPDKVRFLKKFLPTLSKNT